MRYNCAMIGTIVTNRSGSFDTNISNSYNALASIVLYMSYYVKPEVVILEL